MVGLEVALDPFVHAPESDATGLRLHPIATAAKLEALFFAGASRSTRRSSSGRIRDVVDRQLRKLRGRRLTGSIDAQMTTQRFELFRGAARQWTKPRA